MTVRFPTGKLLETHARRRDRINLAAKKSMHDQERATVSVVGGSHCYATRQLIECCSNVQAFIIVTRKSARGI